RRAHEIVERERDQAREQRAVAERERNDLRRQVEDLTERRQNLVRERDLDAKLAKCMSDCLAGVGLRELASLYPVHAHLVRLVDNAASREGRPDMVTIDPAYV